jgi:hypothetical protein
VLCRGSSLFMVMSTVVPDDGIVNFSTEMRALPSASTPCNNQQCEVAQSSGRNVMVCMHASRS